jgi:GTP-dependent phosphoenolpyruvate carboxykinase
MKKSIKEYKYFCDACGDYAVVSYKTSVDQNTFGLDLCVDCNINYQRAEEDGTLAEILDEYQSESADQDKAAIIQMLKDIGGY